ncbi:MAG: hypothetical protein K9N57_04040 [Candidatus Marinimicrobia bacterium]|nr:hypothetical protein [Candidatus Neomarinimicrobiota bacterium]
MPKILRIILIILIPTLAYPQTIQFSIYVEDEATASQVRDMDFGQIVAGQGPIDINPGDGNVGVFKISGKPDQDVIVTMDFPDSLTHESNSGKSIPLNLGWAYQNNGASGPDYSFSSATIVPGDIARFRMKKQSGGPPGPPPNPRSSSQSDVDAFVFVYGTMYVGDVNPGWYTGTVTLTVEYD